MKLSEYINFRNRGKINKNTNYNIRTQHFYDGQPMLVADESGTSLAYATGIAANFMNELSIPDTSSIALEQKRHFLSLYKTKGQKKMLIKLNQIMNPIAFQQANIEIDKMIQDSIKNLEAGFDRVLSSAAEIKKIKKQTKNTNLDTSAYSSLNMAYKDFLGIYQSIKNKRPALETELYVQKLDQELTTINNLIANNPKVLIEADKITAAGIKTNYISYLAYLIMQVKGVSMLEHQGIEFIKQCVEIPENVELIGSGQILIGGKQASQDAILFDKNLQLTLDSGRRVVLADYLKENHTKNHTISFTLSEWERIMNQALGLQSKYHRGGYIQMGKVKFNEIINLDMNQARALRYLHILSKGLSGYQAPGEPFENVSHRFNVKAQHEHYKALFSYCLGNFMHRLMSYNYFMLTANGVIDSYSYYTQLFNRGHYFAPIGAISVTTPKEYRVAIKET